MALVQQAGQAGRPHRRRRGADRGRGRFGRHHPAGQRRHRGRGLSPSFPDTTKNGGKGQPFPPLSLVAEQRASYMTRAALS
ncbi:hypothetical protein MTBLM5_150060 [Magnetospirillum sp. LM-5]|nr:hypothetical protein MTBLM5_150060 [Magnetospirillum sp. LM-5]